jgi:hypothetical protein
MDNNAAGHPSSRAHHHTNDNNIRTILHALDASRATQQKANMIRHVHPTYMGYVDIMHSTDSGQKIDMIRGRYSHHKE